MKKVFSAAIAVLVSLSLVTCVFAAFANPPITDGAEFLSANELSELSARLGALREKYGFEVAVYTEEGMSGYDVESTADDIYDYMGYGAGENADGIMLYICESTREYQFTTCGIGIEYFNSNGLRYMEELVVPYLAENDWYGAFSAYAAGAEELLEMAANGEPYNEKERSPFGILFIILLPLVIAFFMMRAKLAKMKTAIADDYAANYMRPGSMNMRVSRDLFLYSQVTKTEKPKSESETHTSSSGRTHGGSGGSF